MKPHPDQLKYLHLLDISLPSMKAEKSSWSCHCDLALPSEWPLALVMSVERIQMKCSVVLEIHHRHKGVRADTV